MDPRVKRTRRLIEEAFAELLDEKGFQQVTVQDITDRATVNRTTFYAHFEDKHALLDRYIREGFQQVLAATVPASAALSIANLRQLAIAVAGFLVPLHNGQRYSSSERQGMEPLVVTALQEELYHFLLDWLQYRASSLAGVDKPLVPETIAAVASWAIFGAALQWAHGEKHQPMEEVAQQVVDVLVSGIADVVASPAAARKAHESEAGALPA